MVVAFLSPALYCQATTYTLSPITSPYGSALAFGLNDQGQVVGGAIFSDGTRRAFLWQSGTGIINLGVLAGDTTSEAVSINNAGQVVGVSYPAAGQPLRGFLWQANTGMIDVGAGAGLFTQATGINQQGVVIGYASSVPDFSSGNFVFTYTARSGIQPITVPGMSVTDVEAINNSGQMVVGTLNSKNLLLITPGTAPVEIQGSGNLVGAGAMAMNDSGTVVGYIEPSNGDSAHGFVWNQNTGFVDLGYGVATGINNLGQVVGVEDLSDGSFIGYLYEDGTVYNLATLLDASAAGWTNIDPRAINNNGQIAGFGTFDGQTEAFLLTPNGASGATSVTVPEPATLSILTLAVIPLLRRRR
jgi:probable HAF family extracellular repeat protein